MFTQGFFTACLKAVRKKKKPIYKSSSICLAYMKEAQILVTKSPDYDFKHFGQLINQLGRRMHTMMINSLWMHMDARRYRAIHTSIKSLMCFPEGSLTKKMCKSVYNFMTKHVMWEISGAPETSFQKPNPSRYAASVFLGTTIIPLFQEPLLQNLIQLHKSKLEHTDEIIVDPEGGYFTDVNIKEHPNIFFRYLVFLFDSIQNIEGKAPFQLVPQYTMKRRCITMGIDQTTGMMMRFQDADQKAAKLKRLKGEEPGTGTIELLGIDTRLLLLDRKGLFEAAGEKRCQVKQTQRALHDKKRKRIEALEEQLLTNLDAKRLKTEAALCVANRDFERSTIRLAKTLAAKPPKLNKKRKPEEVDPAEWKIGHALIAPLLFHPPKGVKKTWNGIITTDGITCSWHRVRLEERIRPIKQKRKTPKKTTTTKAETGSTSTIIPLSELGRVAAHTRPKEYGNHGEGVWIDRGPLNIVAVDPGHATLVDAIRYHHNGIPPELVPKPLPENHSTQHLRRHTLQTKLAEKNRTHFSLTNAHWQTVCGRRASTARRHSLMKKMQLQPAIDLLAQHSSKVSTSTDYKNHLRARLQTLEVMKAYVQAKAPRRWNFECHQKEQLAVHKLSKDLFSGCTGSSILVWGNGGFGPTSRGHASAPNQRLRRLLSKYIHSRCGLERAHVFPTERLLSFRAEQLPTEPTEQEAGDGQAV
jgi:hypothetical protein